MRWRYNPNKPTDIIGLIEARRANRNEAGILEAAAQQFPLWTNAVLPDCCYGRALWRALRPRVPRVRGADAIHSPGAKFAPAFLRQKQNLNERGIYHE